MGAIATSGTEPLFRMIQDGVVEVRAEIVETALAQIKENDTAEVEIPGVGIVKGSVRLVSRTVDPTNRLGEVRVSLEAGRPLRTGIFAGGWIVTDRRDGLTAPTTAVLTDATGDHVFEVEQDTLVRRDVTAGLIWNDRREILDGLADGAVVIAKASAFFSDGDKVNPIAQKVVST